MSYRYTTAVSVPMRVVSSVSVDRVRIRKVTITMGPPSLSTPRLDYEIEWAVGYEDAGAFVQVDVGRATISGQDALAMSVEVPPVGLGRLTDIEARLFAWMRLNAHVPEGRVGA